MSAQITCLQTYLDSKNWHLLQPYNLLLLMIHVAALYNLTTLYNHTFVDTFKQGNT